jgi:hypothetical protein
MRKANLIQTSIWDDAEFAAIGPDAQLVYLFFVTQPTVTTTGLLPLRRRYWAQRLFSGDQERLETALNRLEHGAFVWVDEDTEELVIRSWVKHNVQKSPNMEKGARDAIAGISSVPLRMRLVDAYPTVFDALPESLVNPSDTPSEPFPEKARERVIRGTLEEGVGTQLEKTPARARNAEWDALVAVFGYTPTTKNERALWGDLSNQVRDMETWGPVGEWLAEAASRYHRDMPNATCTPPALVKHAPRLMAMNQSQLPERKMSGGQLIAKIREDRA